MGNGSTIWTVRRACIRVSSPLRCSRSTFFQSHIRGFNENLMPRSACSPLSTHPVPVIITVGVCRRFTLRCELPQSIRLFVAPGALIPRAGRGRDGHGLHHLLLRSVRYGGVRRRLLSVGVIRLRIMGGRCVRKAVRRVRSRRIR